MKFKTVIGITALGAGLGLIVREHSLAHSENKTAFYLPANTIIHQSHSLPRFRHFVSTAKANKNDSLTRIAVISPSQRYDSLSNAIVVALHEATGDPRFNMKARWSKNWSLNKHMRSSGIFRRPAGIYKDTSDDPHVQYREAWVKFTLPEYKRPWRLTILERNNPFSSDFIFSRDTSVLHQVHQEGHFGWRKHEYISEKNSCSFLLASEVSPEIGVIQVEPLCGLSAWCLHTPDFSQAGAREESRKQFEMLSPRLVIFPVDHTDSKAMTQVTKMAELIDPEIPILLITTSKRKINFGSCFSFLRIDPGARSLREILSDAFRIRPCFSLDQRTSKKTAEAVGCVLTAYCLGLKPPAMDTTDFHNGFNRFHTRNLNLIPNETLPGMGSPARAWTTQRRVQSPAEK
ncbi:MAG TPA: hypothetical protein VK826_08780 [Bacteroidia bacterium]|nr:hypothetical protein [Bacteroidia bacterium]